MNDYPEVDPYIDFVSDIYEELPAQDDFPYEKISIQK
jgi:hypothetical protein